LPEPIQSTCSLQAWLQTSGGQASSSTTFAGQASSTTSSTTNFAGVQANSQADLCVPANRFGMTPHKLCLGDDVFCLGEPPADSSRKSAIQHFFASSRQIGTHREFEMEPMQFSVDEIAVMMKFQELHVSKTGGARKYVPLQVMYKISQRYWTLDEVKASYETFGAKNYLSKLLRVTRPPLQPKDAKADDLQLMVDIGNLAKRMKDYGDKIMNKINITGDLTYARMPDNDVVLLMGDNSDMESDFEKGETFDIQRVHFDANYEFDVIPQEVEALLTAIAVMTECSKTWFF